MVGILKTDIPDLRKALMEAANPGQHLLATFNKCGLIPVNLSRVMNRIPSCSMAVVPGTTRTVLNSTFGERLEELCRVAQKEKVKRGKKLKIASGKAYIEKDSEEGVEYSEEDVEKNNKEEQDEEDPSLTPRIFWLRSCFEVKMWKAEG